MKNKVFFLALFLGAISACQVQETDYYDSLNEVSFFATGGDAPMSKTTLQADGTIWWNPNDEINIFYGEAGNYKFTSSNTTTASNVVFKGSLKYEEGYKDYWAVYPYSADNTFDGSSIKVSLPSEQYAVKDSFKDDLFISIAKTTDHNLTFYNVCGGVKFSVTQPGVTSVVFKGNNNEILAGVASVAFDSDGKPFIKNVSKAKTEITVKLEDGGTFVVGAWYYIVAFPGKLLSGYTMTVTQANTQAVKTSSAPVTIKRSIWGVLEGVDSSLDNNTPGAVNLGLSVKWAECNLGASKPEEYGDYYAWGEISSKSYYDWDTYKWCGGSYNTLTKYNTLSDYGIIDNTITLELSDDAAHVLLGSNWRIPTDAEWMDLMEKCTWTLTTLNGEIVYKVTSKTNGNSIFLPNAGHRWRADLYDAGDYGDYWSSSLSLNNRGAWGVSIDYEGYGCTRYYRDRFYGYSVRPVYGDYVADVPVTSVSLNKTSLTLTPSSTEPLVATISPTNAAIKWVNWSSSDKSVVTVSSSGVVTAIAIGTAIITATAGGKSASCTVTVTGGPRVVDLGLSVKWAACNIGSSKPEEYGDYYAWGETEPKKNYSWSTYKFYSSLGTVQGGLIKYNTKSEYGLDCYVDDNTVLEPEDDVAHVKLGGKWRMPTDAEWTELRTKCTRTWVTNYNGSGINGSLVSSKTNGNSIFLPAAGYRHDTYFDFAGHYGEYWSSSLDTDEPLGALSVFFGYGNYFVFHQDSSPRRTGLPVRPVFDE